MQILELSGINFINKIDILIHENLNLVLKHNWLKFIKNKIKTYFCNITEFFFQRFSHCDSYKYNVLAHVKSIIVHW